MGPTSPVTFRMWVMDDYEYISSIFTKVEVDTEALKCYSSVIERLRVIPRFLLASLHLSHGRSFDLV